MFLTILTSLPGGAAETWEKIDKRIKPQIFEVTVGVKWRLRDGLFAQLADASPKGHFPVFSTTREDKGFQVVSFGSSFPIRTSQHDKTYFLTSGHVVTNDQITNVILECERFFAGAKMYAEQQKGNGSADEKYNELLQIINLSKKNPLVGPERQLYSTTVDAIWDTYDSFLGIRADPGRVMFKKYSTQASVEHLIGYFLHPPGPMSQKALEPQVYKVAKSENEPDLAVLTVPNSNTIPLEFDTVPAEEGQEIQVIGYPTASDVIDKDSSNYFAPTFSSGRISRVAPRLLQVDAPITNGSSGSPVVSLRGKVLGVVAVRAIVQGKEMPNFGGAITIQSVQSFAPDLFGKPGTR
jgi:S1-C subfamily serine protease